MKQQIMNEKAMVAQGMPDREQELDLLTQHVEEALSLAKKSGADEVAASASTHAGMSVNVRLGEVETLEHNRDRGISVTVYVGRSQGHASSADLQPGSVKNCVQHALDIAKYTAQDKCNGLADPDRLACSFPDLDLWHPRPLDVEEAIERALECEAAALADKRISNSEGGSSSSEVGLSVYGNSNDFRGRSGGTRYGQSCVVIAGKNESMQRDYWYDSRRSFGDLETPASTGAEAARRTVARLGARKIKTCRLPVLFAPEVARGIIGHFIGAISGGALYRNASFLKDTLGQQLFPEWFGVTEHPFLQRAVGSAAFDSEGVATNEREIINQGVLNGYVLSSYSARRLGLETTGNAGGVHNLRLTGHKSSFNELLRDMDCGLLVTEVMGQGVSMVTGDYSRGASGFWVENGQIVYPVEEVTIAGNLTKMFSAIRSIGDDRDERSNIQAGSILLDGLTIAGS
ncbi:MAG: PmbA protein [Lysobacterales bacterium]